MDRRYVIYQCHRDDVVVITCTSSLSEPSRAEMRDINKIIKRDNRPPLLARSLSLFFLRASSTSRIHSTTRSYRISSFHNDLFSSTMTTDYRKGPSRNESRAKIARRFYHGRNSNVAGAHFRSACPSTKSTLVERYTFTSGRSTKLKHASTS